MDTLKAILTPVFLVFFLLAVEVSLLFWTKRTLLTRIFALASLTCLLLFTFRPTANLLVWSLERKHPPLDRFGTLENAEYIVVLTDWDTDDPALPYTSNIGYKSALRALEAHRIHVHLPKAKIIVSGSENGIRLMTKLLSLLGVPDQELLGDVGRNTWASAARLKDSLSGHDFILVTSAVHLPRALLAFERRGLTPIAAPADFYYGYQNRYAIPYGRPLLYYVPNVQSLVSSDLAVYEYIGILWYTIRPHD